MKVYLDDVRDTPEGWTRCFWPEEVIELLKTGKVEELSLDHDLNDHVPGSSTVSVRERTGYDVLTWIEEQVYTTDFVPPVMYVHSANAAGMLRMKAAIEQIHKIRQQKENGQKL